MAPPRQRATAVHDDSRSEASSTTREQKTGAGKGRKAANNSTVVNSASHVKISSNVANVTSAPMGDGDQPDNQPKVSYFLAKHPKSLPSPGPRCLSNSSTPTDTPTKYPHPALSHRILPAHPLQRNRPSIPYLHRRPTGPSSPKPEHKRLSHQQQKTPSPHIASKINGTKGSSGHNHKNQSAMEGKNALNHIIGQDRVSKNHLAFTVRKHFNSAGLAEQEAIARFLYKVREEGRGRQFRLRFQP
ncbi:hypothetical protein ANOM_005043 [Aspergillus nomiae NRRL 13137]|uniref:Histone deacetylase complex subunit SAP30 Sin3 binding domain-containing protein n=1 Tax=Aspergillus nomiae NRRL (strain ATCC 15546 / NRRL 13137 / CBS 260.88 / M93) TaxID=1509407 RepID=A0A0L1J5A6_ASPN3|nr:uncharacterized protein ANOM_005043 [Aspergillus nomiae NRRL 13137]KNG86981.1 hypothetical protein ANOM_005043 [Aspergillus nomiae NRRL 13137]